MRKLLKKVSVVALSTAMVVSLGVVSGKQNHVYAEELVEVGVVSDTAQEVKGQCGDNLYWEIVDDKVVISGTGDMYNYGGDDTPFYSIYNIQNVEIQEGVTSIGDNAFYFCYFTNVTLPSSLTRIGDHAFYGAKIEQIVIPDSVTSLGKEIFDFATNLKSVKLSANIESIEEGTFRSCVNLKEINIPDKVKSIGNEAFLFCSNLESVDVPESVETMGDKVFYCCHHLKSATLSKNLTEIPNYAFYSCEELTSIVLLENIKSIGKLAFKGCTSLNSINIPEGVETIEFRAFENCTSLKSMIVPKSVTTIGVKAIGMVMEDAQYHHIAGFKMFGYQGSAAENYAKSENVPFVPLYAQVTGVKAEGAGKGKVQLTWPTNGSDGYCVYKKVGSGKFTYVASTTCGQYIDTNASDTDYSYYQVRAFAKVNGETIFAEPSKYVYAKGLCAKVAVKAQSAKGMVKLTWNKADGADGYLVYAIKDGKYGFVGLAPYPNMTYYNDTKASTTSYSYYFVFPYHKSEDGKTLAGACSTYVYGIALR